MPNTFGKYHLHFSLLMLFLLTSGAIAQSDRLLNYSIVGWASPDRSPSFGKAIVRLEVQRLLLGLASAPRTAGFVDSALGSCPVSRADLEELRLIRREGDLCFLNFTLFTAEDIRNVRSVSEQFAPTLAAAFMAQRTVIDSILRTYDAPGIDPKAVAFIVLGCMSLDWDGLAVTADLGYRTTSSERPDGDYIPYADERTSRTYERIYWGSNSSPYGNIQVTSFGDHFSRRRAFPEFFWAIDTVKSDSGLPSIFRGLTRETKQGKVKAAGQELGSIVLALRDSILAIDELAQMTHLPAADIRAWLALLSRMTYVTEENGLFRATIPVFTKRDRDMIRQLRDVGREVMISWLRVNYDKIKGQLSTTAPVRNGAPYGEGFTMIWHWLFGMANDELVKSGLFADPYAPDRVHKGFIPTVYSSDAL